MYDIRAVHHDGHISRRVKGNSDCLVHAIGHGAAGRHLLPVEGNRSRFSQLGTLLLVRGSNR